jgi:hypothetical protein
MMPPPLSTRLLTPAKWSHLPWSLTLHSSGLSGAMMLPEI